MSKQLVSGKHRLRNTYWSLVGAASATILSVQPVMAETIWDRFSTIMRDIYGQLVGISTIVAVTVAAIALLVRMVSRNQRAVDEATSWLKRVVVTWIILNTLGFTVQSQRERNRALRGLFTECLLMRKRGLTSTLIRRSPQKKKSRVYSWLPNSGTQLRRP